jgi:RimJ/RimL family protein N-acetyltransferase
VQIHPNDRLNKSNQIIILVSKAGFKISNPTKNFAGIGEKLELLKRYPLPSIMDIINLVKDDINNIRNILYQSGLGREYRHRDNFPDVTYLDSEKIKKLVGLKSICSPLEWNHGSLNLESKNTFGVLVRNKVVAAAQYLDFPGKLASIGVLTHPDHRFHGYAQKVARAALTHAISNGYEPHYQTIIENFPAIGLSKKLGFRQFGYSCRIELTG